MEIKRRGFLGGMLASFAAPLAKDAEVFAGAQISHNPLRASTKDGLNFATAGETAIKTGNTGNPWFLKRRLKLEAMKLLDPEFVRDKARRHAKDVYRIDPDIMALRSVSPAGKIAMQREKQYREQEDFKGEIASLLWAERESKFNVEHEDY